MTCFGIFETLMMDDNYDMDSMGDPGLPKLYAK